MHQPNIHEVRENLAEYLEAAARGEEVLICRRNQPVARLVAVDRRLLEARPLGLAPDAGTALPAAFWDPLPPAWLEALAGDAALKPATASGPMP